MQLRIKWSLVFLVSLFILTIALLPTAFADGQKERVGIVLLHGKARGPSNPNMVEAVGPLKQNGFLVAVPEMPWSKERYIDKTYEEALNEIDQAVARLRVKGATKIVIAGQSMGGDAALTYAAYHGYINGLILLSPAHGPDSDYFLKHFADDIAKAKAMIDAGQGDKYATFHDVDLGVPCARHMKASIYYSFFSPDSIGAMQKAASMVSPDIPVLYVKASQDPHALHKSFLYDKLPANPLTRYVVVNSDHVGTPFAAISEMLSWLQTLASR